MDKETDGRMYIQTDRHTDTGVDGEIDRQTDRLGTGKRMQLV